MKTKYPIIRFVQSIDHNSEIPVKIADGIRKTVEDFYDRYKNLDETVASQKSDSEKWSRKEILGHLLDSASNNQQRFVRAQYEQTINFLSYAQQDWVSIQKYNSRSWKELLDFWKSYNLHLAHIIKNMPMDCLEVSGTMGSYGKVTIGYVVVDYLGHMQHHIRQIDRME